MVEITVQEKIKAYIEILRPGWWLACFFIGLTPGILAIHWRDDGSMDAFWEMKTIFWALGYWASVVGMYVFNDMVGKEEDETNNPKRPIPAGMITTKEASIYSAVLLVIGVCLFWIAFEDPAATLVQLACIGLIVIHSHYLKVNVILGLAAGLIPVAIWIGLADFSWIMVALFSLVFFWELALDVPENILHFEGDMKAHPHTMAIILGKEKLASIGIYFAIAAIASSFWLAYLLDFSARNTGIYLVFAIIGAIAMLNGTLAIRKNIQPMLLGKATGLAMLFILLNNIGLMIAAGLS